MSRCRRITTDGRGVTHAAAARRDPPSSLRWSRGWASEKERALTSLREARKTRKSISSWSESATGGPSIERAVDQLEEDVVVADDDDVLDVVVVDQRLESAEPEERVEDRLRRRLLAGGAPRAVAGVDVVGHRRLDEIQHDRPAELLLRGLVEPAPVGGDGLAQLLGRPSAQLGDDRTSRRRGPPSGAR